MTLDLRPEPEWKRRKPVKQGVAMEREIPKSRDRASRQERQSAPERTPGTDAANRHNRSLLDQISWWRLCVIIWRATPLPWRLVAFPYGVVVYRQLLAASDTLRYLHTMHATEYENSRLFRLLRPRYHKVEQLLRRYGLEDRPE